MRRTLSASALWLSALIAGATAIGAAAQGSAAAQTIAGADCPAASSSRAPPTAQSARQLSPLDHVAAANTRARQRPDPSSFVEARQIYTYAPGAIYELYANPNFVSVILLEPGERLVDVAAGDTVRWMIQESASEAMIDGRTIVLVKPQAINLRTNIVLVTDRRTYSVEASSQGGRAYSAEIAWCYRVHSDAEPGAGPTGEGLNFSYRVRTTRGSRPAWAPVRVWDNGYRTWIEMPDTIGASDLPPLFVVTAEGRELVNYRVQGRFYVVDRLFDVAELRLGARAPVIVRIERERSPRARARGRPS